MELEPLSGLKCGRSAMIAGELLARQVGHDLGDDCLQRLF